MVLKSIGGAFSGTGIATLKNKVLGGVLISADSTNDTTVIITNLDTGDCVFRMIVKQPIFVCAPIYAGSRLQVTCSGTGGLVQIYEWIS
jgi:hypothetical protein